MRHPLTAVAVTVVAVGALSGCRSTGQTAAVVAAPSATVQQVRFLDDESSRGASSRGRNAMADQAVAKADAEVGPEPLSPPVIAPVEGDAIDSDAPDGGSADRDSGVKGSVEVRATKRGPTAASDTEPEVIETPEFVSTGPISISRLADIVRVHFPVIQEAAATRQLASGEVLSAMGAFDHKLEGFSNSQPLDFYENYWHNLGVKRDTYWGGQVFAGYRTGRGIFEPWYLERETNKGGEFKTGFIAPLARDRFIDANRAELWRAQLEQGRVEPEIRAVVIAAVRDATVTYWQWVAAGERYRIANELLQLGVERIDFLEQELAVGEAARIDVVDNRRTILSRQAKLVDARRKLEQSAVKLSLFLRNDAGQPIVLPIDLHGEFPPSLGADAWGETAAISIAQSTRPELEELRIIRRQFNVMLRQASNETLPEIDAGILLGQDVGEPTSAKRDKSEFELEATLQLSVPLERRKALGKIRQLRAKLRQITQKTRFASDKINAEAAAAHAALVAAAERVIQTTQSLELNKEVRDATQQEFDIGDASLLELNIREQMLADAAIEQIDAQLEYFSALANYAAALGFDNSDDLTPLAEANAAAANNADEFEQRGAEPEGAERGGPAAAPGDALPIDDLAPALFGDET